MGDDSGTTWYIRMHDNVLGPYTVEELESNLTPTLPVCRAGEEDWRPAGEVEAFRHRFGDSAGREEDEAASPDPGEQTGNERGEKPSVEPTLENFCGICERATGEDLLREYLEHREKYDRKERRALRQQLKRRGLFEKVRSTVDL